MVGLGVGAALLMSLLELSCVADERPSPRAAWSTPAPPGVEPAWPVASETDGRVSDELAITR
jgi:hypothetical protein